MGRTLSAREVVFGFGAHSDIDDADELLRMAQQADRGGPDISRCRTTNLPTRPAPTLARTVTTFRGWA
jgi:hypothetical protein